MAKAKKSSALRPKASPTSSRRKPLPTKRVPLEAMKDATFYHITAQGKRWAVHKHGAERASGVFDTKAEAERAARQFKATNKHIIVHKRDGSVQKWITSKAA